MNKKRLLALPIVCIVVAMLGVAVMASSATKGFKVEDGGAYNAVGLKTAPKRAAPPDRPGARFGSDLRIRPLHRSAYP